MKLYFEHIDSCTSTNDFLKEKLKTKDLQEGYVIYTGFQTKGKGQAGNSWEAEKDKNLLFSIFIKPKNIFIEEQFIISQMISVAVKNVLDNFTDNLKIKWPNDIYAGDKKLGGILIENSLFNASIKNSILGIGLNINQETFSKNLPNPVSLYQITGEKNDRNQILQAVCLEFITIYSEGNFEAIRSQYFENLYRKDELHIYSDDNQTFNARIKNVEKDGKLILETESGEIKSYYFKEVKFLN